MDPIYVSERNRGVVPARPGEFPSLRLGPLSVWPPVVLAPMAGITNYPFRRICRRFGAGLYVSEMITARALVEGHDKTLKLAAFGPDEAPRSLQLYGVDPRHLAEATRRLVGEGQVDHIDLNFGCPVRKITSKGGGAAIPYKPRLLRRLVRAVVGASEGTPVTIKVRLGIDEEHMTFRAAGDVAEGEGCAAIALHARTAAELYDGEARWEFIGELVARLSIPVLGNGDIWEAWDALRMMRATGAAGVVVGRGCMGRPWLFRDLACVFDGAAPPDPPTLGEVVDVLKEHARLMEEWFGTRSGLRMMRKLTVWYTKGFPKTGPVRDRLIRMDSLDDIDRAFEGLDMGTPFPPAAMRIRRGKRSGRQKVALPHGYLDQPDDDTPPTAAAGDSSPGG
ncbi:MAG TPA: tRNA dihydrouridine synthase DusB [Planctomycetes bacterium]|nr:tRNA dihydrouridine synthase DusB [Planctomycetota bacterium]